MNKLAFFSTSSRPIKALEELSKNFDIKLIVTKTDKIIGRNKEKTPNDVKLFAIKNNIELFEIDKFNKESKFLLKETLEKLQVDLAVTFDFGFIVPKELFEIPKYKFINIHFSLLPKYRGASAVQFAILNDEKDYGITYHLIDATLDTGDILYQSVFPLDENFNSDQAYSNLFDKCSLEISKILNLYLEGSISPTPQNHSLATYTFSKTNPQHTFIFKEDAVLNNTSDERKLFRQIKAFNPWPKPQIETTNLIKLKQFSNYKLKENSLGLVLKINDANYRNGQIEITEITILNGKVLKIQDFISGYLIKK
jgi:methionyl-tRNA formyltransferase